MAARVGSRDYLHSTALGKAILAFLPDGERDRLLRGPLLARTERTMTDPDRLRTELGRVRERGVAEDRNENEVGARCLGAPIFDHRGMVIGAISVSAPESRLDDAQAAVVAEAVRAAAAEVTCQIGGAPDA
jgi:DNA-binding IclR family transcriptional regulator